jgi:hypothetical protein
MGMTGEDWRMVILGLIAMIQAVAIVVIPLLIQRGRKENVALSTQAKATLDTVHTIVNSRYDALVAEVQAKQLEIDRLKSAAPQ